MSSEMMGWGFVTLCVFLGVLAVAIPRFRKKDVWDKPKKSSGR